MRKLFGLVGFIGLMITGITGYSQDIAGYPKYPVPARYRLKGGAELPYKIDNSQKIYFPEIIDQWGWSCNQASSIGYVLTYELNRLRNTAANLPDNKCTPGFPWNFLNSNNSGIGVSYFDSWEIVKAAGCANYTDYPYYNSATGIWMSGYEKYYRAMQNRVLVNYSLPIGTPADLAVFKQYLADHFESSPDGGIGSIQIASSGVSEDYWKDPDTNESWPVVTSFGNDVGHAWTLVGYNDSVRVDVNNDGKFTNDQDINGDGVVDMRDWEIGAFMAVNSWGKGYGHGGKSYVLYSVASREGNNGGIWGRAVHVVKAVKYYNPQLTMRVVMRHEQRNAFRLLAGLSTDTTASEPQQTLSFPIFNYQGGKTPLEDPDNANDKGRFELGLDITPLINSIEPNTPVKFFLIVQENDPNDASSGQIDECAVIHYAQGTHETVSNQKNVAIINNSTTYVSLIESLNFDKLKIGDPFVTNITLDKPFYAQLKASGGVPPYRWDLVKDYQQVLDTIPYERISGDTLGSTRKKIAFQKVTLPFEFPFYGVNFSSVIVDVKGALHFNNEYIQYPYAINKDLDFLVRKSIVPLWANLGFNSPDDVLIYQATDSVVTFEWKESVMQNAVACPVLFSARLYADGRIEFKYGYRTLPPLADYSWKSGISNGDAALYKYAPFSGSNQNMENRSILYTPLDYPAAISCTDDGILSGVANEKDHLWNILLKVTDSYNQVRYTSLPISTITRDTAAIVSKSFPNPFTRTTSITFTISQESSVSLVIYDFAGRKVKECINQTLPAGIQTYYWNARDYSNRDVNRGTYIYRLTIGDKTETGKMILMR